MSAILPVVKAWAKENFEDPRFQEAEDGSAASFSFSYELRDVPVQIVIDIDEPRAWLQFFAYLPFKVPEPRKLTVAAVLGALAPRLPIGTVESLPNGRVRYRSGMDVEGSTVSGTTLDNQVKLSLGALEQVLPAVTAAVFTEASTEEALKAGEAAPENESGAAGAPPSPAERWVERATPALDWASHQGSAPIRDWAKAWAQHLRGGAGAATEAERQLGRGILFVGQELEACEGVARLAAAEAGLRFAYLPGRDLSALNPEALSAFAQVAPVLVFLEPGPWLAAVASAPTSPPETQHQQELQKVLKRLLAAPGGETPVLFASAVGSLHEVADDLLEVGHFDRAFAVPELAPEVRGSRFLGMVGEERCGASLLKAPAKVGKMLAIAFGSREGKALAALHLQRLAGQEWRKVEFIDLVQVYTRGFVEAASAQDNPDSVRRQVAVHEAGHAAVSVLDSQGANVPEFSTIIPSGQVRGVVVSSIMHQHDVEERTTYSAFRHMVRVSLGGRAGEELVYGSAHIGNGAGSDLANCARLAGRAFSQWGYAPAMDSLEASRSNLAVILGTAAQCEVEHVITQVRAFLADEYTRVMALLQKHRPFLMAIADRLMVDPIVDQDELRALCKEHGVPLRDDATVDPRYGPTGH